mgnify:CR=1 FL=1
MATNPKASFPIDSYKISWSETNKTWQIWKGLMLIDDVRTKHEARIKVTRLIRRAFYKIKK